MSPDPGSPPDREAELDLAVFEYEAELDRGEVPDRAAWIVRYPELSTYFRDRDELSRLSSTEESPSEESTRTFRSMPREKISPRPERLGDYILGEKLGGGGEGLVFRARHSLGDLTVALKMVGAKAGGEGRLQDEIRAIASLRHEHIVRVFSFGRDQGLWYYTMEEMEGGSLRDHLPDYQARPRKAVELLQQVASGVHHAHTRGILHLDLKPANVLLDGNGRPLVSDFGLAKRLYAPEPPRSPTVARGGDDAEDDDVGDVRERLALTNSQVRGTGPYMSPEMASGESVITTSADIYGLGAILYTLLTGQPPFHGQTLGETLRKVVQDEPVPPRTHNRKVDRELQAVCLKCLHKDPLRRYGSADALANDLRRWLNREPTLAGRPTVGKQIRYWFLRHPLRVAAASLAALLLWIAVTAGMLGELQVENHREAGRLAHEVEIQLRMIGRAADILARQPDLRERLRAFPAQSGDQRRALDEYLGRAQHDYNDWFGIAGGNPLINVFILNKAGILLADTFPGSEAVGKDFSRRDYYHLLMDLDHPRRREAVVVSRAFHSVKDYFFKIPVSTRIWDGDECLGVLVANIAIGPRLVEMDMADEPEGAMVISPMDWSYADRGLPPPPGPPPYLAVLDRSYTSGRIDPIWPAPVRFPRLADFGRDPTLTVAAERFRDGAMVSYHRVGDTPLVVVLRQSYPWPIRLFLDARLPRSAAPALALLAFAPVLVVARRAARGAGRKGPRSPS